MSTFFDFRNTESTTVDLAVGRQEERRTRETPPTVAELADHEVLREAWNELARRGGQSPGIVDLRFDDPSTLSWNLDGVSSAWTVYRGDLATVPGNDGTCLIESHPSPSYVDTTEPASGAALVYLVAGEGPCGTGEVGPRADGSTRNVACP